MKENMEETITMLVQLHEHVMIINKEKKHQILNNHKRKSIIIHDVLLWIYKVMINNRSEANMTLYITI